MRRSVLSVYVLLTVIPVTQAAVTQGGLSERFLLPSTDVLSRFVIYGKCADGDELSGTILELQGNQGHPFRIQIETAVPVCFFAEAPGLNMEIEGLSWNFENAWPLVLYIVPAIADGTVQWTVADFALQDGAGDIVDNPPRIIAVLIGLLQDAWRDAFTRELIEVVKEIHTDGLPGIPRFENVYIDHEHENIIVDVLFIDPMQMLGSLVGTGRSSTSKDNTVQHSITEEQMNAAFGLLAAQKETC